MCAGIAGRQLLRVRLNLHRNDGVGIGDAAVIVAIALLDSLDEPHTAEYPPPNRIAAVEVRGVSQHDEADPFRR